MSDLVDRLRGPWSVGTRGTVVSLMTEAADELSHLRAENERLTGRLEVYKQEVGDLGGVIVECEARITELEGERDTATRALSALREALLEHHNWQLNQGTVWLEDFDGKPTISINGPAEYSDSDMCERTTAALSKTEGKG